MKQKCFCRNCGGIRNHKELHKVERKGSDGEGYFQWIDNYLIIECEGCETVSFLNVYGNTEMTYTDQQGNFEYYDDETIYPNYLEKSSEISEISYLPQKIKEIYSETIKALKAKAFILTAGGLRAIIEAICNELKIKKGNLEERINLLHNKGHLTISESHRLHSIRFLGNDALHEIETPKKEHLYLLLDIINHLLTNLFINDAIIKDKIETMVNDFEDFQKIIQNKLSKDMIGNEFTISEILGKSKRLISKPNFQKFEQDLQEEIKNGKYSYLEFNEETNKFTVKEVSKKFNFGVYRNIKP
ncbi:uncharacterized protein DUF4145 [Chryseobacterium sp. 52]|uniref:DUF4145 domain-containing protein n=1 Tax=Chryseobacterium sp. 52 TaxID=2035213 RepID=UPI000C18D8D9|nr:DUF4145 domain-containing protein [Chryseobacterium sp. 52]PIF46776.1 uncharacterized protein DUF4145 [Chryseobacterium sp. 52]